jgi:hypothetical protein
LPDAPEPPELAAPPPSAPALPEPATPMPTAPALPALREAAGLPAGAGLCFADPVAAGGRVIVPVARVRTFRGHSDARPVGILALGEDGVRLERFEGDRPARLRAMTAGLLTGVALGLAARRPTRGRRPAWRR